MRKTASIRLLNSAHAAGPTRYGRNKQMSSFGRRRCTRAEGKCISEASKRPCCINTSALEKVITRRSIYQSWLVHSCSVCVCRFSHPYNPFLPASWAGTAGKTIAMLFCLYYPHILIWTLLSCVLKSFLWLPWQPESMENVLFKSSRVSLKWILMPLSSRLPLSPAGFVWCVWAMNQWIFHLSWRW